MQKYLFYLLIPLLFLSCRQNEESITGVQYITECKNMAAFIQSTGFDKRRTAFSTSERKIKGLALVEFPLNSQMQKRIYQHPSWKMAGGLGPIVITEDGSAYVAPIPIVNIFDNKPEQQNTIYKVDPVSGEMNVFIELPRAKEPSPENPYGILGLAYDCETGILYASSVSGSTRTDEVGRIYSIRVKDKAKIIDQIDNIDAMGLELVYFNEKKSLFFGEARRSNIFSVAIDEDGQFKSKPTFQLNLTGFGPRGDDKARKLRFDKSGNLVVFGVEFNYNLIAPSEKMETMYSFQYNITSQKWEKLNKSPVMGAEE